ncbi:hypothetical protein [Algoriphagus sp. PAP.12]|uniref:hypothetical protein n=1 Tax=Algoriphagus sp. PAP.12 TaxID=2996678 RepID=UPI00227B0012|nr:hypothetical protein [Algoriphagus sp. PAP.12]
MTWEEAEIDLRENIILHNHLDKKNKYKVVVSVPPTVCNRLGEEGFRIQVGEKSIIPVPFSMLIALYEESRRNNGIYNNKVFLDLFPEKLLSKPCYVHSVGKLFVAAGVADQEGNRNYRIK